MLHPPTLPASRRSCWFLARGFGALLPLITWTPSLAQTPETCEEASAPAPDRPAGYFVFEPGAGLPAIRFPQGETLRYRAGINLAFVSATVGTVTQTSSIESQRPSVILTQQEAGGEVASVRLHAEGSHLLYTVDSKIEARVLPQEWPRVVYSVNNEGTERRRREILLGRREGVCTSSYRGDTKKGAPEGTRIWKEAKLRPVPEGTLDMISAVFMARTLVRENRDQITFPLIDNQRIWQLTLRRGAEQRMETAAGTFDVLEVVLEPGHYPDEVLEEDPLEKFEGVFGIHGSMHLWVEKHTGIAVRIQGDLPVGPLTLGVDVELESFSGTAAEFAVPR